MGWDGMGCDCVTVAATVTTHSRNMCWLLRRRRWWRWRWRGTQAAGDGRERSRAGGHRCRCWCRCCWRRRQQAVVAWVDQARTERNGLLACLTAYLAASRHKLEQRVDSDEVAQQRRPRLATEALRTFTHNQHGFRVQGGYAGRLLLTPRRGWHERTNALTHTHSPPRRIERKPERGVSGTPTPNCCLLYTSPSPRDRG